MENLEPYILILIKMKQYTFIELNTHFKNYKNSNRKYNNNDKTQIMILNQNETIELN